MSSFDYKKIDSSLLRPNLTDAPQENPFFNKKVVFTGDLDGWERSTAAFILQKLGADVNTTISCRTQIVIVGKGAGPAKLEKIIDLLSDGIHIQLMNERIFVKEIEPYKSLFGLT